MLQDFAPFSPHVPQNCFRCLFSTLFSFLIPPSTQSPSYALPSPIIRDLIPLLIALRNINRVYLFFVLLCVLLFLPGGGQKYLFYCTIIIILHHRRSAGARVNLAPSCSNRILKRSFYMHHSEGWKDKR
uniref:(northern house mosquito) hypothetical protein n=1 Tax=Culex pipiens TaxID=7175 RepID=A0A8D8A2G5_CULPI